MLSAPTTTTAVLDQLAGARERYLATVTSHYDDILTDITARASDTGALGKSDIGALLLWKRLRADTRWAAALMDTPDHDVRTHTAIMIVAARDTTHTPGEAAGAARAALTPLPGFTTGDALASALILAAAPTRMAIYDRRAHHALTHLNIPLTNASGRYRRYITIATHLADQLTTHTGTPWTPRHVDTALYVLGK